MINERESLLRISMKISLAQWRKRSLISRKDEIEKNYDECMWSWRSSQSMVTCFSWCIQHVQHSQQRNDKDDMGSLRKTLNRILYVLTALYSTDTYSTCSVACAVTVKVYIYVYTFACTRMHAWTWMSN